MTLGCIQQRTAIAAEQSKCEQACESRWTYLEAYEDIDASCKFAALFLHVIEDERAIHSYMIAGEMQA